MDPHPHPQPHEAAQAPARRRSSVAYDPARDKFTEIPDTVAEEAISNGSNSKTSSPTQAKDKNMSSPPDARKRQRSASPANRVAEPSTHLQKRQKIEQKD